MPSPPLFADLHCHSTHSDGTLSPIELVEEAWRKGIKLLSLTDHDCLSGLPEAANEANRLGIDFIPGIELSARYKGGNLHILGYGFDPHNALLNQALAQFQLERAQRNAKMLRKLQAFGLEVTLEEFLEVAGPSASPGRPHAARLLVEKGYCPDLQAAFAHYLSPGKPGFVPKYNFEPAAAIKLLHQAGGKAVLAHPCTLNRTAQSLTQYVDRLKASGLDGVEAYNSAHHPEEAAHYLALAQELGLWITGGSDYHGANKKNVELGEWQPRQMIPFNWISPHIASGAS